MEINHGNIVQLLQECVDVMVVAVSKLKQIEKDTPATHDELLRINGSITDGMPPLAELIEFVGKEKPNPVLIGNRLKDAILLLGEVLREKTRILKNTPAVFRETNDLTGVN